ncbi:MAG: hypothetical protein LUE17_07870 [Planctomycetaceae bacterium]|nr:hypothetical protein [Planctomycetaceae bacterium]
MTMTYIVSDLHIGDGRREKYPRNNFFYKNKYAKFTAFLDQVKKEQARLFILGDLFDFWLADIDGVIHQNWDILDALDQLDDLIYIPGNHDIDFAGFYAPGGKRTFLNHPFFLDPKRVILSHEETIGGTRFIFLHGHQGDAFNEKNYPVTGRLVTILAGLIEDRISRYIDYSGDQTLPVEPFLAALGEAVLKVIDPLIRAVTLVAARRANAMDSDAAAENALSETGYAEYRRAREAGLTEYADALLFQNRILNTLIDQMAEEISECADMPIPGGESDRMGARSVKSMVVACLRRWLGSHGNSSLAAHLTTMYRDQWRTLVDKDRAVLVVGHTHQPGFCRDKPNGSDRIWYYNSGSWSDSGHDVLTLDDRGGITYFTWTDNGLAPTEPPDLSRFLTP